RRGRTLALRWLVTYSRERREKHMEDKLSGEILDALEQQGNAFKRKDDMYRMAQANKAFAHYRWEEKARKQTWQLQRHEWRWSASATSGSWPTSMRARRPRPSGSSTTRAAPTRWARRTKARPRWTGWRRSRSAASRSRLLRRRRSGAIIG